jgi:hypothetical protein
MVQKRFPNQPYTRYTGISGFIFLRFFVPAVIAPRLFKLECNCDIATLRTLTLIGKTVQSLSNLVEFSMKEPYMGCMNPFIRSRFEEMKLYIDRISV